MTFPQRLPGSLLAVLFVTGLALPGPLSSQNATAAEVAAETITLQPGDVVRVGIWREDDLSGEFPVDEMGIVTLPLLGERDVNGIPMRALRDQLIEAYRVELRNPSITITPLRQVHVLGYVNDPGLYTVDPTFSLAGAIALAGGANPSGDLRRIRIIRGGEVMKHGVRAEATLAGIDVRSGDQVFVGRRGWFERNQNFLISTMLSATAILIRLF
jgi:protein involved in polysaccharide export with SLBB domain